MELANVPNRSMGEASDNDCKLTLQNYDEVCEWPLAGMTWYICHRLLTIVRAGSGGGETKHIQGGFKYRSDLSLRLDWNEIKSVAPAYSGKYRAL